MLWVYKKNGCMFLQKLCISCHSESESSVSCLAILLEKDNNGTMLSNKIIYDIRCDFTFSIFNFPYLCSSILYSPGY